MNFNQELIETEIELSVKRIMQTISNIRFQRKKRHININQLSRVKRQKLEKKLELSKSVLEDLQKELEELVAANIPDKKKGEDQSGDFDSIDIKKIIKKAKQQIIDEKLYTSSQVAEYLGSESPSNPRQYAADLRRRGELLGVKVTNKFLYPAFQFDEKRKKIYNIVKEVSQILSATDDPWGILSWWVSPNARLPQLISPKDLLPEPKKHEVLKNLAIATKEESG